MPHSIMLNISYIFAAAFAHFLFIISPSPFPWIVVVFLRGTRGREKEKFKKQLIGFLRRGCFIASGLNVNVIIIMIIRNVFFSFLFS